MILLQKVKMIEQVFFRVASYICPIAKFSYSDVNDAFRGIFTLWNSDNAMGNVILLNSYFVVMGFTFQNGS